jgi:hypothetical protein
MPTSMMVDTREEQFQTEEIEVARQHFIEEYAEFNKIKNPKIKKDKFYPLRGQDAKGVMPLYAAYIFKQVFARNAIATEFKGIEDRKYLLDPAKVAMYVCQWPINSTNRKWFAWQLCVGISLMLMQGENIHALNANHTWARFGATFLRDNENFTLCKEGCRGASMTNGTSH